MADIDGKKVAEAIKNQVREGVSEMAKKGKVPGLVTILIGDNPSSATYVKMKQKACKSLGIYSEQLNLDSAITQHELLDRIGHFNRREDIHGILVQLPLPGHIDEFAVMDAIEPQKDVDGFSNRTIADICRGSDVYLPPCTPQGVIELLKAYDIPTAGKHVVIIGRSNIVGTPLANLLRRKEYNSTVTICHSKTSALEMHARLADILVAAIGKPRYVGPDMVRQGAVVIDVGVNKVEDKLCGDVDYENVRKKCRYITPVPGGVGPMTIAILMRNTYNAALRNYGIEDLKVLR